MKALYFSLGVLVGGVAGSLVTFFFTKRYYDKKNDEDIKSVIESFEKRGSTVYNITQVSKTDSDDTHGEKEPEPPPPSNSDAKPYDTVKKESFSQYLNIISSSGYKNYARSAELRQRGVDPGETSGIPEETLETVSYELNPDAKPEIIPPEEFGEDETYHCISLFMYADGYLCDTDDLPLSDPVDVVGPDVASHFGEYEDDTVYVRNDKYHTYYEVNRCEKTFRREDDNG